jgi:hypothetical protein
MTDFLRFLTYLCVIRYTLAVGQPKDSLQAQGVATLFYCVCSEGATVQCSKSHDYDVCARLDHASVSS